MQELSWKNGVICPVEIRKEKKAKRIKVQQNLLKGAMKKSTQIGGPTLVWIQEGMICSWAKGSTHINTHLFFSEAQ